MINLEKYDSNISYYISVTKCMWKNHNFYFWNFNLQFMRKDATQHYKGKSTIWVVANHRPDSTEQPIVSNIHSLVPPSVKHKVTTTDITDASVPKSVQSAWLPARYSSLLVYLHTTRNNNAQRTETPDHWRWGYTPG